MRNARVLCGAVLAAASVPAARGQTASFQLLAQSGVPYPGLPSGSTLDGLDLAPTIGPTGTAVFLATLRPSLQEVVCTATSAGPSIAARAGQPAPGGGTFDSFFNPVDTPGGLAFEAALTAPSTGGVYRWQFGVLGPDVLAGQPLPGVPSGLAFVGERRFARLGLSWAFTGSYGPAPGTGTGTAVWSGAPGPLALLARDGDPAPGVPGGAFGSFAFVNDPPALAAGEVVISGGLTGGGNGVWRGSPGALRVVAATGLPAPGVPGAVFRAARAGTINAQGTVVLWAGIDDPALPGGTGLGLWADRGGILGAVALPGRAAPQCGGALYASIDLPPIDLADNDYIAYTARLTGPGVTPDNNKALFAGPINQPRLIARTGDQAPGYPAGALFRTFDQTLAINGRGQVAFLVTTTATPSPDLHALYTAGPEGGPVRVLRGGQTIAAPGPMTIDNFFQGLLVQGGQDGLPAWLNDAGQMVVNVGLSSGAGILLIQLPWPIPCYANCDLSTTPPTLNVNDFICFQQKYAAGDPYANCDGSTVEPVLNISDFVCFLNRFAAGCP